MDLVNIYVKKYESGFCEMAVNGEVVAFVQNEHETIEMIENWLDENDLTDGDVEVFGCEEYYN